MASVKILFLLVVASVLASVYSDESIADLAKDVNDDVKKTIDEKTAESKGFFSNLGDKVGQFYDSAVEKGKEAAKATGDAISTGYDKLKEKAKDIKDSFSDKKPE